MTRARRPHGACRGIVASDTHMSGRLLLVLPSQQLLCFCTTPDGDEKATEDTHAPIRSATAYYAGRKQHYATIIIIMGSLKSGLVASPPRGAAVNADEPRPPAAVHEQSAEKDAEPSNHEDTTLATRLSASSSRLSASPLPAAVHSPSRDTGACAPLLSSPQSREMTGSSAAALTVVGMSPLLAQSSFFRRAQQQEEEAPATVAERQLLSAESARCSSSALLSAAVGAESGAGELRGKLPAAAVSTSAAHNSPIVSIGETSVVGLCAA